MRAKMGVPISAVLTFFFTILYLQYKMNRFPAPAPSDADVQLDVTPIDPS
jgi:hypothetical protein